jgi:cysteinyl-tRNA synthetase
MPYPHPDKDAGRSLPSSEERNMLQVYNTLTRRKEPFPKQPGELVTMYVCGPTVYKPSHIGHMVGPVIFDTVKRYLTYLGYSVRWVVNITDVDDKLIARAAQLGTTVSELARKMTDDYFACLKQLNVTGVDLFPRATEHIPGMIRMIARLIEKGYAYPAGGSVWFDVSRDDDYGKLCNRDPEQMAEGGRIEPNPLKRNPGDFALWKGAKPGEPAEVIWDSPWGPGRPGWHIECSVMSTALLGETIDIHGGGLDLKFPHHENELAQSESATGKTFARLWMHNGLLKLRSKEGKEDKMAGSIGNVLNVADALQHVSGEVLRFFILNTHYTSPIDLGVWDREKDPIPTSIEAARKAFGTFERFAERYQRITGRALHELAAPTRAGDTPPAPLRDFYQRFRHYMDDDFNTGGATSVLFELASFLNRTADAGRIDETRHLDDEKGQLFLRGALLLKEFGQILGLFWSAPPSITATGNDRMVSGLMQLIIDLRNKLRAEAKKIPAKDDPLKKTLFAQTDMIRDRLGELGIALEDRPTGTTWRRA